MKFNLKQLVACIDLTRLVENDSEAAIAEFCVDAVSFIGSVAGVCVYPQYLATVQKNIHDPTIKLVSVVNFPEGKNSLEQTLLEIEFAINAGANEIDCVIPAMQASVGIQPYLFACKQKCNELARFNNQSILLKVILETGELAKIDLIKKMTQIAIDAGADFIKTSTGKTPNGATLEAAQAILEVIQNSDKDVGLKVSGGVKEVDQAFAYMDLAQNLMGADWLSPQHFRMGCSGLLKQIKGLCHEQYQECTTP